MDKNLKCLFELNKPHSKIRVLDDGVGVVLSIETDNDPHPEKNIIMGLSLEEADDMIKCLSSKINILRKVRKK